MSSRAACTSLRNFQTRTRGPHGFFESLSSGGAGEASAQGLSARGAKAGQAGRPTRNLDTFLGAVGPGRPGAVGVQGGCKGGVIPRQAGATPGLSFVTCSGIRSYGRSVGVGAVACPGRAVPLGGGPEKTEKSTIRGKKCLQCVRLSAIMLVVSRSCRERWRKRRLVWISFLVSILLEGTVAYLSFGREPRTAEC